MSTSYLWSDLDLNVHKEIRVTGHVEVTYFRGYRLLFHSIQCLRVLLFYEPLLDRPRE